MYREFCRELISFINSSPTPYHVVDNLKKRLSDEGYVELFEENEWTLEGGGRYFTTRGMTSLIAFRIPDAHTLCTFRSILTHSDSPVLKLKTVPHSDTAPTKLSVEVYGGPILESFLDRPLSLSGRATVAIGSHIENRLVDIKNACLIPRVPPHLSKDIKLNPSTDLSPLYSLDKGELFARIAEAAGVGEEDILSLDIYAVPSETGFVWGERDEFISSPRIDNLQSVFSSLSGFLNSCDETSIPVMAVLDNEETGSLSENGADSTFLSDTLRRVSEKLSDTFEDYCRRISQSFFVSCDVAHARHPNHPELFDALNSPVLNGGVAIKYNASGRYVTNSISAGLFSEIAKLAGVPTQTYHNRSDIQGGSTLGRLSLSHVSALSLDVGAPILAMHSALETAGALDTEYLARVFEMFYSVNITKENGVYSIQ